MTKKLSIKLRSRKPVITIDRGAFKDNKFVYVARANKKFRYSWGRSHIVYIGTTQKGAKRVASSAAYKGETLLLEYGVKHLEFFLVTCSKLPGLDSWRKLERALIIRFRQVYGDVPRGNKQGRKIQSQREAEYFSTSGLDKILKTFE